VRRRGKVRQNKSSPRDGKIRAIVRQEISRAIEDKYQDSSLTYFQVDRAGTFNLLFNPAQGIGESQRIGDRVRLKRLLFNWSTYYSIGVTNSTHNIRVVLLRWKITTSVATPATGVIFQQIGGVGDYRMLVSPFNWQASKQNDFDVIYDRVFSVGSACPTPLGQLEFELNSDVVFDPASTNAEGVPYLFVMADDVTGAHVPDVQFQYYARVLYTDA
jgi:hypothetical protein